MKRVIILEIFGNQKLKDVLACKGETCTKLENLKNEVLKAAIYMS